MKAIKFSLETLAVKSQGDLQIGSRYLSEIGGYYRLTGLVADLAKQLEK